MVLEKGEKIHVIHRRYFQAEARRHFVGVVDEYDGGVARVTGFVYTVDRTKFAFVKRPERRTRIVSLVSGDVFINILPTEVDIDNIMYQQENKTVRVTDGSDWHLDLSEVTWM